MQLQLKFSYVSFRIIIYQKKIFTSTRILTLVEFDRGSAGWNQICTSGVTLQPSMTRKVRVADGSVTGVRLSYNLKGRKRALETLGVPGLQESLVLGVYFAKQMDLVTRFSRLHLDFCRTETRCRDSGMLCRTGRLGGTPSLNGDRDRLVMLWLLRTLVL